MRAFIAVTIPAELRAALAAEGAALARQARDIRPVPADSLHLTLAFLGETPAHMVDSLRSGMEAAAGRHRPFAIGFGGGGTFPRRGEARVAWAGITGQLDVIEALQASVTREMRELGLRVDNRPFSAHVTLARVNRRATPSARIAISRRAEGLELDRLGQFAVTAITLVESDLTPAGAVYRELLQVELGISVQTEGPGRRFGLFGAPGG